MRKLVSSERRRRGAGCSAVIFGALLLSCAAPASRVRQTMVPAPSQVRAGNVADLHVHVTMKQAVPFFHGVPGSVLATDPDAMLVNQVDSAVFKAHGVRVVFATIWPPPALRPGRAALDEAVQQLQALKALPQTDSGFAVALNSDEVARVVSSGRVALVPALEGAEAIKTVADVDVLFAAGFRSIGLVHFTDNALGDAEDGQFGRLGAPFFDGNGHGLTPLGRDAVRRMMDLGVVIDVAHADPTTIDEVLALAEARKVPIISSHVGSGMTAAHTLSEAHARRIAALGGLIGVGLYRHDALVRIPREHRFEGFEDGTCDEVIAHWLYYQRRTSADAVMLGSDLSSLIHRGRPGGSCPEGMRSAADLGVLFAALIRHGVDAGALATSGDRAIGLLGTCEKRATAVPVKIQRRAPSLNDVPL